MPARRALLEESENSVTATTTPRRAQLSGIGRAAIRGVGHCAPRRAQIEVATAIAPRAIARPRTKRTRFVFPAAAVLLTSALGFGASLAPQASAAQSHPVNASVSAPAAGSLALATADSTAGAGVMDSSVSAISDVTTARLASEDAQQTAQASQDEQRAATLAAAGRTAADKLAADAKAAADQAAAAKAAADQAAAKAAAAAASQRAAAQQAAAQQAAAQLAAAASSSSTATSSTSSAGSSASTAQPSTASSATTATASTASSSAAQTALNYALAQVGKPYVWGASGPDSFDCSGLMQAAYAAAGISLPRTTYAQVAAGTPVSTSALAPGDLVFFYGNEHVGMYIGNGKVVHAADYGIGVIISNMDTMTVSGAVRVA